MKSVLAGGVVETDNALHGVETDTALHERNCDDTLRGTGIQDWHFRALRLVVIELGLCHDSTYCTSVRVRQTEAHQTHLFATLSPPHHSAV